MLKNICKLTVVFFMLMVASANANAKEFLIVDVYFDDGSVLPNAKFKPNKYRASDQIKIKHENEFFTLKFEDLKTLEVEVEPGTSEVEVCINLGIRGQSCGYIGRESDNYFKS